MLGDQTLNISRTQDIDRPINQTFVFFRNAKSIYTIYSEIDWIRINSLYTVLKTVYLKNERKNTEIQHVQCAEDIRAGAWKLKKGSGCFKNNVAGPNIGLINLIALLN